MHKNLDVLWLSVSPHLKCFDQRLLSRLTKVNRMGSGSTIRRWEYCQTLDEPCSVDAVVDLLHEYLQSRSVPSSGAKVHLVGHGVSGVVGLLYARKYPQHVASLTLLSVGAMPAINWQAHYYALRKLLPCSREVILGQMTRLLFGQQSSRFVTALAKLLSRDLDSNLTLHSLAHDCHIPAGTVDVPLLVCNGEIDDVVTCAEQTGWSKWLKAGDRIWHCPDGRYFFHFYHYKAVAKTVLNFWSQLSAQPTDVPFEAGDTQGKNRMEVGAI